MNRFPDSATEEGGSAEGTPAGVEVVLLVEGDSIARDRMRGVLSVNGYQVLDAHNELEALALCAEHQGPIDLLLADDEMPELGVRALKLRPRAKVLFTGAAIDNELLATRVRETLDLPVVSG